MADLDSDSSLGDAGSAIGALGQLIEIAKDDPQAKQAASNIGKAAVTLTRAVNNVLLPLAALNFGIEKAKRYFESRFAEDLAKMTAGIPADDIVEPKASIAGPVLQGLAFTHEEPDLKAMYLSLLSSSMDRRRSDSAHPAFVELIKQIHPSELEPLTPILTTTLKQAIVEVRLSKKDGSGYMSLRPHYTGVHRIVDGREIDVSNFTAMLENWIRLGLIEVDYTQHVIAPSAYDWVEARAYIKQLRSIHDNDTSAITLQRGIVGRTAFGAQFASVVGMYDTRRNATPVPDIPQGGQ